MRPISRHAASCAGAIFIMLSGALPAVAQRATWASTSALCAWADTSKTVANPNQKDALATLVAIEEIKTLKARYFRYVNTKQWKALRALFLPDATFHLVHRTPEPEPIDVMMKQISGTLSPGVSTVFHGGTPEIEVKGDTATGIWPLSELLVFPVDRPNRLGLSRLQSFSYYRERYVRRDGVWRIATLRLELQYIETVPALGTVKAPTPPR